MSRNSRRTPAAFQIIGRYVIIFVRCVTFALLKPIAHERLFGLWKPKTYSSRALTIVSTTLYYLISYLKGPLSDTAEAVPTISIGVSSAEILEAESPDLTLERLL